MTTDSEKLEEEREGFEAQRERLDIDFEKLKIDTKTRKQDRKIRRLGENIRGGTSQDRCLERRRTSSAGGIDPAIILQQKQLLEKCFTQNQATTDLVARQLKLEEQREVREKEKEKKKRRKRN